MALRGNDSHKEIVNHLSQMFKLDRRVAELVATSIFRFDTEVIRDSEDLRPIMHRYWGKFAIRGSQQKKK